jgi:hypothetical protein
MEERAVATLRSTAQKGRHAVGFLRDRPQVGLSVLLGLVVAHSVVSIWLRWLNPYKSFEDPNSSNPITIYLGLASASAIIAGFAGVVLVFAVGSPAQRIRQFRTSAGEPLQRLWLTVVAEPFAATFISLLACVTQLTSGHLVAPWLMEAGFVLLGHSAMRLLWLLWAVVKIVAADDIEVTRDENSVAVTDLFPPS